jgi:hypothetical protein
MKRFVEGEDRRQGALLPHCLDDDVTENNSVRVIEAFIDELDLATLGFDGVVLRAPSLPSSDATALPRHSCLPRASTEPGPVAAIAEVSRFLRAKRAVEPGCCRALSSFRPLP